ncbi:MAG: hypothetical protein ABIO70_31410 [Pseudomonadota bacterium]
MIAALLLALPVFADCDDALAYVARAEQAVLTAQPEEARQALADAAVAWACGPVVDPSLLARYWNAEGALAMGDGDLTRARLSFAAAWRIAPDSWPVDYGIKPYIQYKAAAEEWTGVGVLKLHPEPAGRLAFLDGAAASFPAEASAGLHLVQVGATPEHMELASFAMVAASGTAMVLMNLDPVPTVTAAPGALPVEPPPVVLPHPTGPPQRQRALLGVAGVSAVLAGGAMFMAQRETEGLLTAQHEAQLDGAFARQVAWSQVAVALGGTAGVSLVLYAVF